MNTVPLTVEQIKANLLTNDKWLARGLLAIYERQTEDEKITEHTNHNNTIGFNGVDAKILTSFAKFYLKTGFLSPKQMKWARRKMLKYAGQLLKIAEEKKGGKVVVQTQTPVVPTPVQEPVVDEEALLKEIGSVYCQLSPENLTCDGELPAEAVQSRMGALNAKLEELFKKLGRRVDEMEAFNATLA